MTTGKHPAVLPARGLYAITPDEDLPPTDLAAAVSESIAGGAAIVQYRRKSLPRAKALREAIALQNLCASRDVTFIVNDDIDLALACRADGVHLGRDDGDWESLARNPTRSLLLGISCYDSLDRAREACAAGADYVAFGSFFPSLTKPQATRCSLDLLRQARHELQIPIVAIGGISQENGHTLIAAGADFLAVISGVFGQSDIRSAAARYASLFGVPSNV